MKLTIKEMTLIGICVALISVFSQISIPLPFSPVPITLQPLAVFLSGVILGGRLGSWTIVIYILLGSIGAPVFSGGKAGISVVMGPTGGYLISYPIVAYIIGIGFEKNRGMILKVVSLIAGLVICYLLGMIQLSIVTGMGFQKAFLVGVLPYFPLDIVKLIVAAYIGSRVKAGLKGNGLLLT